MDLKQYDFSWWQVNIRDPWYYKENWLVPFLGADGPGEQELCEQCAS